MAKLNIPDHMDAGAQHALKMEILHLAVDMLKNSQWEEKGDVADEIKNAVDQLTESYNEL